MELLIIFIAVFAFAAGYFANRKKPKLPIPETDYYWELIIENGFKIKIEQNQYAPALFTIYIYESEDGLANKLFYCQSYSAGNFKKAQAHVISALISHGIRSCCKNQ